MRALLLAGLLVAAPAGATPGTLLAAGLAAYAAHDFPAAAQAFRALADDGSALGETMLGALYAHGQGVRADPATAAAYWFRAAQRGYPPAQLAFADALRRGDGVTGDPRAARMWLTLAAQHGNARVAAAARRALAALPSAAAEGSAAAGWRPWRGN